MDFCRKWACLALLLVSFSHTATGLTTTVDLTSRLPADDLSRVRVELEVGGMWRLNREGLSPAAKSDHVSDQLPIHVDAKLSYDARRRERLGWSAAV